MHVQNKCLVLNAYSAIALRFRGHYASIKLDPPRVYRDDRTPCDIASGSRLRTCRERWACETFRVDDELTGAVSLWVPDHLRQRQFVLGLLGHYLRFSPTDRSSLKELTTLIARQIPPWQLALWPREAAKWGRRKDSCVNE